MCNFEYIKSLQYKEEEQFLQEQFNKACTLTGTKAFINLSQSVQTDKKTKIYSKSDKYKEENITSVLDEMDDKNITGFAACDYDCKWWVGYVLSTEEEKDTVKTMFSSFQSIDCSTSKFTVYVKQVIHL
jgi:hypothetical protein